jgi:hypothetical protein
METSYKKETVESEWKRDTPTPVSFGKILD